MIFQFNPLLGVLLLIVPLFLFFPSIGFFIIFIRNFLKYHQKMFGYLSILFSLNFVGNLVQVILIGSSHQNLAEFTFIILQIIDHLILLISPSNTYWYFSSYMQYKKRYLNYCIS